MVPPPLEVASKDVTFIQRISHRTFIYVRNVIKKFGRSIAAQSPSTGLHKSRSFPIFKVCVESISSVDHDRRVLHELSIALGTILILENVVKVPIHILT